MDILEAMWDGCELTIKSVKEQTVQARCLECGSTWDAGRYSLDGNTVKVYQMLENDVIVAKHAESCSVGQRLNKLEETA